MDLGLGLGFTNLLRLAWIAAILPILVASLPIRRLGFLQRMLSSFAARGKIINSSPFSQKFTIPQRYFLHFYVIAIVLTTFLALATWLFALATELSEYSTPDTFRMWQTVFVLHLMEAQVARRLYETAYVFRYGPNARMHIFGYLAGLFFYTAAPLSLGNTCSLEALRYVGGQITEFIVKSQERIPIFGLNWWDALKPFANLGWCQWIGFAIFIWGWLHQFLCHAILGSLREDRRTDEYMIPHGDWFEYVSCPHYLAEIMSTLLYLMQEKFSNIQVIYAGILVASGGSDITVWLLFLFVVSNLVFAAAETHRWYLCKFDSYPRSRRAIIPLIY